MQPNNPAPQPPAPSMDYLNQISTPVPQKTMNPLVLWGAIGGVLIIAIVLFMAILSGGTNNGDRMTTIAAQLSSLKTVSQGATENIQGSNLRTLNSSMALVLTNVTRDMTATVDALHASTGEKDKRVVLVTSDTKQLTDRLEDARLNAVYDRTYAREMTYYLKNLHTEMATLYGSTHNQTAKSFLQKADADLSAFTSSFAGYNGS